MKIIRCWGYTSHARTFYLKASAKKSVFPVFPILASQIELLSFISFILLSLDNFKTKNGGKIFCPFLLTGKKAQNYRIVSSAKLSMTPPFHLWFSLPQTSFSHRIPKPFNVSLASNYMNASSSGHSVLLSLKEWRLRCSGLLLPTGHNWWLQEWSPDPRGIHHKSFPGFEKNCGQIHITKKSTILTIFICTVW